MVKKPVIFFLSKSGGGKDTQADLLLEKLPFKYINTGDAFRELISDVSIQNLQKGSIERYEAEEIKGLVNSGKFSPSISVIQLWRKSLLSMAQSHEDTKGIVLVGMARKLGEAIVLNDFFQTWPDAKKHFRLIPVLLNVSDKEAIRRLLIRRQCVGCTKPVSGLPHEATLKECMRCGGELVKRKDDTPKGAASRILEFKEHVVPVVNFFKKQKIIKVIDGNRTIDVIHRDIVKTLGL